MREMLPLPPRNRGCDLGTKACEGLMRSGETREQSEIAVVAQNLTQVLGFLEFDLRGVRPKCARKLELIAMIDYAAAKFMKRFVVRVPPVVRHRAPGATIAARKRVENLRKSDTAEIPV